MITKIEGRWSLCGKWLRHVCQEDKKKNMCVFVCVCLLGGYDSCGTVASEVMASR